MLKTRVSRLESFRRCVQTEYGNEAELIAAIQGKESPNWMMERGTEFHRLLAGKKGKRDLRYLFLASDVQSAGEYIGKGLHEVTGRRIFDLGSESLEVRGTADWICGSVIQDAKTKTSSPDPRDYESSLQWRFYLAIHEADVFRYNLFYFTDPDERGWSRLQEVVSVNFWRYPSLEQDCREWCRRFLEWAEMHGLLSQLEKEPS